MIEAVENHMPQVIIIDEIGTELEALAARTIAERGVQLIGTAHGNALENLMVNPTLSDLIGGIQAVTLGDEEARRRGTQKTILERKQPPTFQVIVEIQDRYRVAVHPDVTEAVDASLRGQPPDTEIRSLENGEVKTERLAPVRAAKDVTRERTAARPLPRKQVPRMYLFGINRQRLEQAAKELSLNLVVTDNLRDADLLVTSKAYFRRKPQVIKDAVEANLPIYVLRKHTPLQIKHMLSTLNPQAAQNHERVSDENQQEMLTHALQEAEKAAAQVKHEHEPVELTPQGSYIRRLQHLVAERSRLSSKSVGREPERHVTFYPEE
jgi:hypothetical protein